MNSEEKQEYARLMAMAQEKGWNTPQSMTEASDPDAWVKYWKACIQHENNPNSCCPTAPFKAA